MSAKRRQQIKREGYRAWCPDYPISYRYGGRVLREVYDRACYEEGHHKAQEEYDSEERRIADITKQEEQHDCTT
tara:strand:+ start:2196 stop:2417 length:222 start_codon:yes stop_codon:yes gene_type:complete